MKLTNAEIKLLHSIFSIIKPQPAYAFAMSSETYDGCGWTCAGSCGPPTPCGGACSGTCAESCKDDCSGESKAGLIKKKKKVIIKEG